MRRPCGEDRFEHLTYFIRLNKRIIIFKMGAATDCTMEFLTMVTPKPPRAWYGNAGDATEQKAGDTAKKNAGEATEEAGTQDGCSEGDKSKDAGSASEEDAGSEGDKLGVQVVFEADEEGEETTLNAKEDTETDTWYGYVRWVYERPPQ